MDDFAAGPHTFRARDIGGGILVIQQGLVDAAGVDAVGDVDDAPDPFSLLGRLLAIVQAVDDLKATDYEAVAANSAGQALGAAGAAGDLLLQVTIIPGSLSPGSVAIKDGGGAPVVIFAGGANSVSTLHPFTVSVNAASIAGAWSLITGANVTALATGRFT